MSASVKVPVVVNAPPVPLLVPNVDAFPEKHTAGPVPVGVEQSEPRLTFSQKSAMDITIVADGRTRGGALFGERDVDKEHERLCCSEAFFDI